MFPLNILLISTGMSTNTMPPGKIVESKSGCLVSCYYDQTCSSMFFDNSTNSCHLSVNLHSEELTISSPSMTYYEWDTDKCAAGYTFNRGMDLCYKIDLNDITGWYAARDKCANDGGHLIKVVRSTVNDMIFAVAQRKELSIWLGGLRTGGTSVIYWLDGTLVDSPAFWAYGQPCTCTDEEAIGMRYYAVAANKSWHDYNPGGVKPYVCQMDMVATVC